MSVFFIAFAFAGAFFVITKGVIMQKVSYMGDGTTTEFTFNFPYFENSNIIVTKNNQETSGYTIIGTSAATDADIPYTGGKVVFDVAPTVLDTIIIARSLPLTRTVDYQPTAKIEPTTLNQDMNYLMEILKDLQDELDGLRTQYAEIADKESTTILLARISAIHDEIVAVSAQITALGDISTLRSSVATNTGAITSLKDAANLTTVGKNKIANLGKPSGRYTDLTLGASWDQYTAPADGYISLRKSSTGVNQYIKIINRNSNLCSCAIAPSTGFDVGVVMPVSKNDSVQIAYSVDGATNYFQFIYANGAE